MTTSNKLLLGLFVGAVLALTSTHIALYAKYKAGHFESVESIEKEMYHMHKVPRATKLVHITGFDNCSVSYSGDPMVKVRKGYSNEKRMSVRFINDTLFLVADTTYGIQHYQQGLRSDQLVQLTLPRDMPIRLDFSSLALSGGMAPLDTPSYNIELNAGSRLLNMVRYPENTDAFFGTLNITANSAKIVLDNHTTVNQLNLTGKNSELAMNRATIRSAYLDVDDSTRISITKKSIQNIRFAPKP